MAVDAFIQCRVSVATKHALRAAAERQQLSESALVKRMLELMLRAADTPDVTTVTPHKRATRPTRLNVRVTAGDWDLLRERAASRCVAPATYASTLIGAHVRRLVPPLMKQELQVLRQSVAQLRAIGINLNQIAKAGHHNGHVSGPGREHLNAMLKVCEALRDHISAVMRANAMSWQSSESH
jgi:hypothetical protein